MKKYALKFLATAVLIFQWGCSTPYPAHGSTITGNTTDATGNPVVKFVRFQPRWQYKENGVKTALGVPIRAVVDTNNNFSAVISIGGAYDTYFGNEDLPPLRILVKPNDTNTWTLNQAAQLAVNAAMFDITNIVVKTQPDNLNNLSGTNVNLTGSFNISSAGQVNSYGSYYGITGVVSLGVTTWTTNLLFDPFGNFYGLFYGYHEGDGSGLTNVTAVFDDLGRQFSTTYAAFGAAANFDSMFVYNNGGNYAGFNTGGYLYSDMGGRFGGAFLNKSLVSLFNADTRTWSGSSATATAATNAPDGNKIASLNQTTNIFTALFPTVITNPVNSISGVITNGGVVWYFLNTNGVPAISAAWGSLCSTTNGQLFVRSNTVWLLK